MIDLVTTADLRLLADTSAEYCTSILMPTHRVGDQRVQDRIRFKNLLARAAGELTALGRGTRAVDEFLAPAEDLLDDTTFWAHLGDALAVYLSPEQMFVFRLGSPTAEQVVVADRFHLKPLLPAVATDTTFHVLALSQNQVRLLRGSASHVAELALADIPPDLAHVVRFDDRERQLHSHGASRVGGGRVAATFHGQGGAKDTADDDLRRFLKAVDDGLATLIGQPEPPLVLAGVGRVIAEFRRISGRSSIVDSAIEGNPEHDTNDELHDRAWRLVQPILDRARADAAESFAARTQNTVDSVADVVRAASIGQIDTLFTPLDDYCWGHFDADAGTVTEHDTHLPGDRDLFDLAAVETLLHHGTVYAVNSDEIPGSGPVAALLRYPAPVA
jgi:hypothetical protein